MKPFHLSLSIALSISLLGCGNDTPNAQASGQALYDKYCEDCHGSSGKGSFLEGIPANRETDYSRQEVTNLILYGRHDTENMPKLYKELTPAEADRISEYLLETLKK